jgi:hypothetical protein
MSRRRESPNDELARAIQRTGFELRRVGKLLWDAAMAEDVATVRAERAVARDMERRAYAHFGGDPPEATERELIHLGDRLRRAEERTDPPDGPPEGAS